MQTGRIAYVTLQYAIFILSYWNMRRSYMRRIRAGDSLDGIGSEPKREDSNFDENQEILDLERLDFDDKNGLDEVTEWI